MSESFENELQRRIDELKDSDRKRVPEFDQVLTRPPVPRPHRYRRSAFAALACLVVLAGVIALMLNRVEDSTNGNVANSESAEVAFDFQEANGHVDRYFSSLRKINGVVPTDQLIYRKTQPPKMERVDESLLWQEMNYDK